MIDWYVCIRRKGPKKSLRCTLPMPRNGKTKRRSEKQQKQAKSVTAVRHRLQDEDKSNIAAATGHSTSRENKRRLDQESEIARLKKVLRNSAKREQRLREKLAKKSQEITTPARTRQQTEGVSHEIEVRDSDELSESNEKAQEPQKTVK